VDAVAFASAAKTAHVRIVGRPLRVDQFLTG
jgi:hypothetical protein